MSHIRGLAGLVCNGLRCQNDFFDLDGEALWVDKVQVINAVAAPGAEADVGLLLVDGCFVDNRLPEGAISLACPLV
jgi:hypothetical protein